MSTNGIRYYLSSIEYFDRSHFASFGMVTAVVRVVAAGHRLFHRPSVEEQMIVTTIPSKPSIRFHFIVINSRSIILTLCTGDH
jgi:hypothetical protein